MMQELVSILREEFGKLDRIDPDGKLYHDLCAVLDAADDAALLHAKDAGIKFVSLLALNRCIRRGLLKGIPT